MVCVGGFVQALLLLLLLLCNVGTSVHHSCFPCGQPADTNHPDVYLVQLCDLRQCSQSAAALQPCRKGLVGALLRQKWQYTNTHQPHGSNWKASYESQPL